jgi:hypothetical protein
MIFSSQPLHVDRFDFAYSIVKSFNATSFTAATSIFLPLDLSFPLASPAVPPPSEEAIYNMNVQMKHEKHIQYGINK